MESIDNILDFLNKTLLRGLFFLTLLALCCIITGCKQEGTGLKRPQSPDVTISSQNSAEDALDPSRYYRIYNGNTVHDRWYFYYDLLDEDGSVIKHECTYMSEPKISVIADDLIKVSVQSGTGMATCGTYYYHINTGLLSSAFQYVLCEKQNLVVYYDSGLVIVRNLFDDQTFLKKIKLQYDLSKTDEPVKAALLSDDLKQVTVTYLTGVDYQEKSETIYIQ